MRRGRRIQMNEHQIRAEVNVTSLVDIAFVLLVIFVMTAPMMIGGVEVNLPQGDVKPLSSESKPFYVSIRSDGRVFVEQSGMSLRDFEQSFGQLMRASPVDRVYVRGDSSVSYGLLVRVMSTVTKTGKPFSLLAEPLEAER
jgi:biopolymer transport protein TolR